MKEDTRLNNLSITIKSFYSMFLSFNHSYYNTDSSYLNLKKSYVSKYRFDTGFNKIIMDYLENLENFLMDSDEIVSFQTSTNFKFRSRTKAIESIYEKMNHYSESETERGGTPIYKCLNDLFGSRIILPNVRDNSEKISNTLEKLRADGFIWRYYTRDKGDGYFAIHCYFKEDNLKFPWELQIWDDNDEKSNLAAHLAHENEKRGTLHK